MAHDYGTASFIVRAQYHTSFKQRLLYWNFIDALHIRVDAIVPLVYQNPLFVDGAFASLFI